MTPQQLKDEIVSVFRQKKTRDLTIIDISSVSSIADYYVIVSGRTNTQVRSLVEFLDEKLEEKGIYSIRKDGAKEGIWTVIDYASVIVHVFEENTRKLFDLEKLWDSGDNVTHIENDI
ncbi:MAG: ribosome silencing factor [Clostridia bacterium]